MRTYRLIGPSGTPYVSSRPGTLGGHRGYVRHRVFFADEPTAVAAGYRPCARCLPDRYREWKVSAAAVDHTIDCASYGRD
jgi:hypothetical protein